MLNRTPSSQFYFCKVPNFPVPPFPHSEDRVDTQSYPQRLSEGRDFCKGHRPSVWEAGSANLFLDIISFQSSQRCCEEGSEETEAQRREVTGPRAHSW